MNRSDRLPEDGIKRMKGRNCKIVINEPGKEKASVIYGILKDTEYKKEFIIVETSTGLAMINKKNVIALKPHKEKK